MQLTIKPNRLTHWASRNVVLAAVIITFLEFIKFAIGFYLGKNALPTLPSIAINLVAFSLAMAAYIAHNYFTEKIKAASINLAYQNSVKGNFILFSVTFLLSVLAGIQSNRLNNPTKSADLFATEYSEENHTTFDGDSLLNAVKSEKDFSHSSELKSKEVQDEKTDSKRKVGYFFLFLLSMGLTVVAFGLACGLGCSGYGVLAAVAFLLDLGIFGSGIYYLLKAFRKGRIKKWREMDKDEQRKEFGRYLKTILITIGAFGVFVLLANLLNN